jgi:hypothetical protein
VTPLGALKPHRLAKDDLEHVRAIYDEVEGHERYELNLYVAGDDEDESEPHGGGDAVVTSQEDSP